MFTRAAGSGTAARQAVRSVEKKVKEKSAGARMKEKSVGARI